jgi:hypothetical protein
MSDDEPGTPESTTDTNADADPPKNQSPEQTMSTDTTDTTAATAKTAPTDDSSNDSTEDTRGLVRYARYALLGGLTLLALVATLRFYFAASNAIDIWVARQYRPLFQAAFNLVVLLVAAVGISWELRQVAG